MSGEPPELSEREKEQIQGFLTELIVEDDLPGASVAVVNGSETVYAEGFGARNLAENTPATGETLFGIGSVTKSFTALATMQLVDDGKLELDDPVAEYIPLDSAEVTIESLLSHTAGVPSNCMAHVLLGRFAGVDDPMTPMSDFDDFLHHVNGSFPDEVVADPGERFYYYATGFTLLGAVIETVTGKDYREYMRERVLDPLEMHRSTFSREAFLADDDRMTPYLTDENGASERPYPFHPLTEATGGLMASAPELANYLRVQINQGEFEGEQLVAPALARQLHEPHVEASEAYGSYGYGWMTNEFLGETLVGHSGDAVVGTAGLTFLPGSELGVVVLSNTSPGYRLSHIARGVLAILKGEDPRRAVALFSHRDRLDEVTGTYATYRGIKTAEVTREGGTLAVEFQGIAGYNELTLVPKSSGGGSYEFETVTDTGDRTPVEFVPTEDGFDMDYDRYVLHRVQS